MNRYMKDLNSGTMHIYQPAWLSSPDCKFVECDELGKIIDTATEVEVKPIAELIVPSVEPEIVVVKPKKPDLSDAENAIAEAIAEAEQALSADASKGV